MTTTTMMICYDLIVHMI